MYPTPAPRVVPQVHRMQPEASHLEGSTRGCPDTHSPAPQGPVTHSTTTHIAWDVWFCCAAPVSRILSYLHPQQFMGPSSSNPGTITPALLSRLSKIHDIQTNNKAFQISWMKTPGSCVLGNPSAQLLHLLLMLVLPEGNCRPPASTRKISACKAGNTSPTYCAAYCWKQKKKKKQEFFY